MGVKGRTWRQRQKKLCHNKPTSLADKPEYIALFKWAKRNGVVFDKMKPVLFPATGRGLMASRKIESGDSLISVPNHLLITSDMIRLRYFSGKSFKSGSTIDLLCLFLIIENSIGIDSFWFPYISMLPTDFTTPSYFTDKELEILPPFFSDHCHDQFEAIQKCLASLTKLVNYVAMETRKNIDMSFENVRWAWNVVNTRSVYLDCAGLNVVGGEAETKCALAPLLDLLNHSCDVEVQAGFSQAAQCYDIKTRTQFEKGSQVFINYGAHSNRKLLVEYGFILPSNCHDSIMIKPSHVYDIVCKSNGNNLSAEKHNIIRKYRLEDTYLCLSSGLSWSLVTALKIMVLDDARLVKRSLDIENIVLLAEHQCAIMLFSRNILKSFLEEYDCHLERLNCKFDNEHDTRSQDRINIVTELVRQEREILRNGLKILKQ